MKIISKKFLLVLVTALYVVFSASCTGLGAEVKRMVTGKEDFGQTFSHWCFNGNIELIEEFLENQKVPQSALNSGLYNARHSEVRKLLLDAGADPNYKDMLYEYAYNDNPAIFDIVDAEGLDINRRDRLNFSALALAPRNVYNNDKRAYHMCELMLENGAEIYPEMFEDDESLDLDCPQTVKMLANRYIDEGGKFDYPDTYVYALCGNISEAVKSVEKDKDTLSEHKKYVILDNATLFGTVEEYKKLKEIFDMEDYRQKQYERLTASCSVEMLEYILEENGDHIKFNPETDIDPKFNDLTFKYETVASGFETAISYGRQDICKYYMENGIKPESYLTGFYSITLAINSGDYEFFRMIYDYIKEKYGNPDEEVFGWCFGLSEVNDSTKKIMDFLFDEGYTFENVKYNHLSDDVAEYIISHGATVTDKIIMDISEQVYKKSFKKAIESGYKVSPELLTRMLPYASSDMIEMVLDNGTEMEDIILERGYDASKATIKLLIERGANLKPPPDKHQEEYGIEYFNLKNEYKKYCRDDLVELLKEYE
ncbi:MAG: ankyrin repeat domain-containing protein [Ruminococcus sp.]|nr:ankyrin repeat domain-containing protein [Ruminococcus sp.]